MRVLAPCRTSSGEASGGDGLFLHSGETRWVSFATSIWRASPPRPDATPDAGTHLRGVRAHQGRSTRDKRALRFFGRARWWREPLAATPVARMGTRVRLTEKQLMS